jgi:flagellar L-ring protein precursor FlgH
MIRFLISSCIVLASCGSYVEDRRSSQYEPLYLEIDEVQTSEPSFGSIYQKDKGSLFAMEGRASRVGDILTVAFTESFQATKSQNASTSKSSTSSVTLPTALPPIGELFSTGADNSFSGSGSTAQSNSLSGSLSVHVVRVFGNGNLEILGQKKLVLNNGDEYIRVSGIVRPRDISAANVVQSDRIANAEINYIGAGDIARTGKKGWYTKLIETISPI